MKTPLKTISLLASAALFILNSLSAVETTPVGYISSTVYGNGGAGFRLTLIAPSFHNGDLVSGTVTTEGASSLTLSAQLTAAAYDEGSHYIEVVNSNGTGYWTDITSNSTTAVSVADDLTSFIEDGDQFFIRKHITIADLFGANNEQGLAAGGDINQADNVQIIEFTTGGGSVNRTYWYSNVENFEGWYDASFNASGDEIIAPHQGVLVTRKVSENVDVVFSGTVRTNDVNFPVEEGLNLISVPSAATKTLATSGLSNALAAGSDINAADNVQILNANGTNSTYWYSNVENFEGWYDASFNPSGDVPLNPGTSFLVYRKPGNGGAVNMAMSSTLPPAPAE
jgi:hypothetical protein